MKAMILAAGLGTRLLPYTLKWPKPLFPVLNSTLLSLTLHRIRNSGFGEIVVNAHHLRQQIADAVRTEPGVLLQEEEIILGTGGGLRMALDHFGHDPVLVVNGDIYHSIGYEDVYRSHWASKADVTLVLHDFPRFNNVAVDASLAVTGFDQPGRRSSQEEGVLAFTGIHVINPEVLHLIPPGRTYCILDCYRELLAQGGSIRAHLAAGHFWTDMGTPADYLALHGGLLQKKIPAFAELSEILGDAPFVGLQNASIGRDVTFRDWACIGKGATIEAGTTLQRVVVWDGAVVPAGSMIIDAIVAP